MEINVQIRADTAPALSGLESSPEADELRSDLEALGVDLRPVHPKAADPLLAPYFVVEVGDDEELKERALAVLRESPLVEAAYTKPPAELP
ncbi:MAG TPA: hypothetical protein VG144_01115 [Gaiellaceae bacterium]|nr:hypothetical protein [Gaiellaceae bacterium]